VDLYLVRHAVAFRKDPRRWPDDALRPLTPKGEREFRRAARGLGRLVPSVDAVLASPFPRAWRTAEILHEETGWPQPHPLPALEKGRTPADAKEALEWDGPNGSLALVGHEPNLTALAAEVLDAPGLRIHLQKGGALALRVRHDGPRRATVAWLLTREALRLLAR
jgi:phosphohistidine phosphatase